MNKKRLLIKLTAILLIASLCAPVGARAALPEVVAPLASAYLEYSYASLVAKGDGDLEIWFEVSSAKIQEEVGVKAIFLYESTDNSNFYWVATFRCADYENMLWKDTAYCMDHVDYEGVPGRYYKAYVQAWAGPTDAGDSRFFWTTAVLCT